MFFQFRFRFWPKVKNILSVIHWEFFENSYWETPGNQMALELFLNILKLYSRSASLDNISFCCNLSSSFSGIQQLNHPRSLEIPTRNSAHNSNQLSPIILPEKKITILHLFLSYRKRMRLSAVQDVIMIKCLWNPQESTIRSVNNILHPTFFAL